jgi:hypothetical protein
MLSSNEDIEAVARNCGADAYFPKSISPVQLKIEAMQLLNV